MAMRYEEHTTFGDYSIERYSGKPTIKAIVDFGGLDKFGFILYIALAIVFYFLPYSRFA
jgi:hypothetical protein